MLYDRQGKYTYIDKDECKEYKEYGATAYRIFLQISHKNHNPSDNRPENLWSLCPRCHLRFDKDHRSLIRLLGGQSRTIPKIIPPEI